MASRTQKNYGQLAAVLGLLACTGCSGEPDSATSEASTQASTTEATSDTTDASSGDSSDSDDTGEPPKPVIPGEPVMPRLTAVQYQNSVEMLLGLGLPELPLEPDTNPYLFYNIGAATTVLSELGTQLYEESAMAITGAVFADEARRLTLVGCNPVSDSSCTINFLGRFGRQAFRRPLSIDELGRWVAMAEELAEGDPWQGLRYAVAGMLQSPNFLYRIERGEPDPHDETRRRYTAWEMASRLSFLIWNSPPDEFLLAAAESGELLTVEGIEEQVERMLADPRTRVAIQSFFAQYLDLSRLDGSTRDPEVYPLYTPSLIVAMRKEVELLVDDLVYRQDTDVRQLFSTRHTFVNSELAELYGLDAPGASPIAYVPVELPEDGPRAGLLTLGAFLTMNAHESYNSPTARGKYIRERVLCQEVPPPPDDVDLNLDPDGDDQPKTLRERLEEHRENPVCAACHEFIDPPGFLFENFDPLGGYVTLDNGLPIDATGDLDGVPLANARELAELLKTDGRVASCMVTQLFRHAVGRKEEFTERPGLAKVEAEFVEHGHRFRELLRALAISEAFRYVADEEVLP